MFPLADLLDDASVSVPLFAPVAYASAFRAIRAGSYDDALAAMRLAVAADPLVVDRALQSPEAKAGIAAFRAKNAALAVASLDAASKRDPQSAEVHRIFGMALALAGQHDASLTQLRDASRLNPQDERSRIAIADVLLASGKPDAALESLRETLRVMPESAEASWQAGRIEQARSDAGAVKSFERAATRPVVAGLARLYAIIGQAYHAQFDLDSAAHAHRQRVRIAPNDRDAHIDLAEVYRAQDRLDDALVELLAAALIDPAHAKTFGLIGQVQAAAGRDAEAVVMLRRAVALDAGLLDARYALSRALLRLGRTDEAAAELRAFEQAQAKAMDDQRRQFRDNQQKIDDVLKGK
jgi:tetratricopeptide (TPR) repeat protein